MEIGPTCLPNGRCGLAARTRKLDHEFAAELASEADGLCDDVLLTFSDAARRRPLSQPAGPCEP